MASLHIESRLIAASPFSSEIDESVEMSSSVLVRLSANDALCSKVRQMVDNLERVEITALCVSEEGITKLPLHDIIVQCE